MVGPQVGKDLRNKGLLSIAYAMVGMLIYITFRFELRFAIGAIVALLHDVLITIGAFSITGREIDLPIIAAFLALVGYSVNDTVIVCDRIRENNGKHKKEGFSTVINSSINETLSRTIMTSGTTLLVVFALFTVGGSVIHNFAFVLMVGIGVGTYSSIFVASPMLIIWEDFRAGGKKRQPHKGASNEAGNAADCRCDPGCGLYHRAARRAEDLWSDCCGANRGSRRPGANGEPAAEDHRTQSRGRYRSDQFPGLGGSRQRLF